MHGVTGVYMIVMRSAQAASINSELTASVWDCVVRLPALKVLEGCTWSADEK